MAYNNPDIIYEYDFKTEGVCGSLNGPSSSIYSRLLYGILKMTFSHYNELYSHMM